MSILKVRFSALASLLHSQLITSCSGRYTISSQRANLGDEIILAIECLKSWTYKEMIHTSTSEVAVTEKMLSKLTKHVEETEAGGDNVSDI